jgi:hypothetical protein
MRNRHPFSLQFDSGFHPYVLLLSLTIILLALLRLYQLSSAPPGFFVDEASVAYNAYSVLTTGKDEHNIPAPVYFQAFGEYKNPLYIYSVIPAIWLAGLTRESVRLTSAFWGLLTIGIFALLLQKSFHHIKTTLIGVIILLINPWHFQLSRIAFEIISFPAFLILAALFLRLSERRRQYFYLFSLTLGISFYSYTSARMLALLMLLAGILIYRRLLNYKTIILSIGIFCLTLLPALYWNYRYPGSLTARFDIVSVFNYEHRPLRLISQITSQYLLHFSPDFLLAAGDGNLRHSTGFHGLFLWSTAPVFFIGLYHLFKNIKQQFNQWLLFGLLISPFPSALTVQSPHALRSIGLLFFIIYIITIGLHRLITLRSKFFFAVFLILFSWEAAIYSLDYFNLYPERAAAWFDVDTNQAIEVALQHRSPYYLSDDLYPGTNATFLFTRRYPPARYHLEHQSDTHFFEPGNINFFRSGTYILDGASCQKLRFQYPALEKRIIYQNNSTCVYEI